MKRFLINTIIAKLSVALALSVCISNISSAQEYTNTPVEISKEKVRIGGQICYSHIVLEKQTLFSICKAYNVTAEDIYRYNPSVKEHGLKKNSILIIPVVDRPAEPAAEAKPAAPAPEAEAQKVENEHTSSTKGAEVQEPAEKVNTLPKEPVKVARVKRKIHTAKWFEDIDIIAEKYGVTPYAIMKANNLTSKKLAKRQRLIIPNPGEYPEEEVAEAAEAAEAAADTTSVQTDVQAEEDRHFFPHFFFPKKEIEMSVLLPLKATGETANRQNMDFYSGVLLAVYDMSKEGISTNLNVFDVAEGNMPDSGLFMNSDVVIGPVSSGDISRAFSAAPGLKSLVSPLDPRAEELVYSLPAMIHAPAPYSIQHRDLAGWLRDDMNPGDTVLVVTEKGARPSPVVTSMITSMDNTGIAYNQLSYSILEGRDIPETLVSLMTATKTNRVYIASESEAFVNDVVRNLNVMIHQKYNVVLYAPSKIRSFETIEVENFHNTNMHVSTGYYIDYNDPKVKEFLLRYRALFNTEPTQFAYQGYDLAKYFIGLSSKYGNRWTEKLDEETSSMLQSNFDFSRTETGGFVNTGIRRIVYGPNWSVSVQK